MRGPAETSRPAAGMVGGGGGRRGRWQTTGLKGLGGAQGAVLEADLNAEHATWRHVPQRSQDLRPYLNTTVGGSAETSVALGHNLVQAISRLQALDYYQGEAQNYQGS